MDQLVVVKGPLVGKTFDVGDKLVIGRGFDCEARLDDLTVSRVHARLYRTKQGVFLEDMRSGNGTFVNRLRIRGPVPLRHEDTIRISNHVLKFVAGKEIRSTDVTSSTIVAIEDRPGNGDSSIVDTLDVKGAAVGALSDEAKARGAGAILKAHERLRTIIEIGNAVQSEFDFYRLLNRILEKLFDLFRQADRGFVMLRQRDGKLTPTAAWTRSGQTEEITISRRIVDEVMQKRVAILSADAMGDDRFDDAASIVNFKIRSMMCAPLIAQDDFLGIIHIDTSRQSERFTPEDLELLTGVANQTALAIANARMHQQLVEREGLHRELELATQLQHSFLPDRRPEVEGMEFAAVYRSAMEVGGDFYDFIALDEDRMLVVIGDVSGKGVRAALLMAKMTSAVRLFAMQHPEPKNIMIRLNEHIRVCGIEDVFVTLLLVKIDLSSRRLTVSNAGHCPALLRRATGDTVSPLAADSDLPLGVVADTEFRQHACGLQPGDVVFLFTDGVTEAMNGKDDLYGSERLRRAVAAAAGTAEGVLQAVVEDVQAFVGNTEQSDDLTCVSFGVRADGIRTAGDTAGSAF